MMRRHHILISSASLPWVVSIALLSTVSNAGEASAIPLIEGNPAATPANNAKVEIPTDVRDLTNADYLLDLAQVHVNYRDFYRAEPLLKKALERSIEASPARQRLLSLLSHALEAKGDAAGALKLQEQALAGAKDPVEKARMTLQIAQAKERAKEYGRAAELYDQILVDGERDGENPAMKFVLKDAQRRSVQLLRQQPQRVDEYIKKSEEALQKNPKDEGALECLIEIYSSIKRDPAKALLASEQLAVLRPNDHSMQMRLSQLYQQNNQPEKAVEQSKKMMAAAPKEQRSIYAFQAAQQLVSSGKKDEGIKLFEEAVGVEPASDREKMLLATLYEQSGNFEKAEVLFRKNSESAKRPEEKSSYLLRAAEQARRRKDYASAEKQLRDLWPTTKDQKFIREQIKSSLTQIYTAQGKPAGDAKLDE